MSEPFYIESDPEWDAWYEDLRRQVATTPPRCLHDLRASAVGSPKEDDEWVTWAIGCACGSKKGAVLGYPLRDYNPKYTGGAFVSPLAFRCADCGRVAEIIDTGIHGYDGENDAMAGKINKTTYRGEGERTASRCPDCGERTYTVTISVSYPDFDIIEDEPELKPRAQDFFMAFDCRGHCPACGRKWGTGDFELA